MISYSLNKTKSKRYGRAARHLQTCEYLAKRIERSGVDGEHDGYDAGLIQLMAPRAGAGEVA